LWDYGTFNPELKYSVQTGFGTLGADDSVGKETGETAHVERWNTTLRQRLGRFVRKTLSFSKSDEYHEIALRLFLHENNLTFSVKT